MRTVKQLVYTLLLCLLCYCITGLQELNSGRECKNDGECVLNAYCHEGKLCLCRDGFIAIVTSKKNFTCVNEVGNIGDVCEYDVQCAKALGTHAECKGATTQPERTTGRCQCTQDAHYEDGICYKNARIGEACQVNDNCVILTPNLVAYCDQSRCVCPPYFHANDNGTDCLPSSDLGGPCNSDDDCITMNAQCKDMCTCKMGYVANVAKTDCLIAADKLHAPCDEDKQCTEFLPKTTCDPIRKRCNCTVGWHEVNGACFLSSRLHEPCSRKEQCLIDSRNITRVECYEGFCICVDQYEMVNRTDCIDTQRTLPDTSGTSMIWRINTALLCTIALLFALKY
ncbi:uncharacterized protein [Rhodnius prolixus]|uniref:Putative fibrillin n=2 Tax=Rhodnius prolixus TaxID=13249 RepID=R4FL12_RHOPR